MSVTVRFAAAAVCAAFLLAGPACGASSKGVGPGPVLPSAPASTSSTAPATTVPTTASPSAPVTTIAAPATATTASTFAEPAIVVTKGERRLVLYVDGQPLHVYRVALGFAPTGDKEREGDGRTPEGRFYVWVKNPSSKYGLSLGVSYPGLDDAERGLRTGLITKAVRDQIAAALEVGEAPLQKTPLGGEIYIHAGGSQRDWTAGCIALDEGEMRELYGLVEVGTPVIIEP